MCLQYCSDNGFQLAGMENGDECYCGNKFPVKPKLAADAKCNTPCKGNSTEICGGNLMISVYFGKTMSFL